MATKLILALDPATLRATRDGIRRRWSPAQRRDRRRLADQRQRWLARRLTEMDPERFERVA